MLDRYFHFLTIFLISLILSGGAGIAAVTEDDVPPSCDVEMMNLMDTNARKSGRREVEMAQRIILKPDSVLEYTCFAEQIARAGSAAPLLNFNEAYGEYLDGSFGAVFGGGTYRAPPTAPSGAGGSGGSAGSVNANACDAMNLIWDFLKCENFNDLQSAGTDAAKFPFFLTFEQLAGFDPRVLPLSCSIKSRDDQWKKDNEDSDVSKVLVDP